MSAIWSASWGWPTRIEARAAIPRRALTLHTNRHPREVGDDDDGVHPIGG